MMQAITEFGLTPSARSRIMTTSGVGKDDESKVEAILGGGLIAERRPAGYPKLKNSKPSRFMLHTCHFGKAKADRAVKLNEKLFHTKGKWVGKRFWLLLWQEQLIQDIFGIVKPDRNRQFRTAFVEICKMVGKDLSRCRLRSQLFIADSHLYQPAKTELPVKFGLIPRPRMDIIGGQITTSPFLETPIR